MGIRNANAVAFTAIGTDLIIPHGDSERWRSCAIGWPMTAHNPSWGFGTCRGQDLTAEAADS